MCTPTEAWQLCGPSEPDYNKQMASEHKVLIRRGAAQPVERWQKVSAGAQNHYWDCEVYQRAAAAMARIEMLAARDSAGGRRSWSDRLRRR